MEEAGGIEWCCLSESLDEGQLCSNILQEDLWEQKSFLKELKYKISDRAGLVFLLVYS